jgi:hypothetical protein
LDAALTHVEARLLATARLLDEYEVTTLQALYQAAPGERPVPPLLLIAPNPPAGMRTRTALGLGHDQQINALLLGGWAHGTTLHVEADGACHPVAHHTGHPAGTADRLLVLSAQATAALLHTLREAHTGQPSPDTASSTSREPHDVPPAEARSANTAGTPDVPADDENPSVAPDAHQRQPPPAHPATAAGTNSARLDALRLPKAERGCWARHRSSTPRRPGGRYAPPR